MGLCQSCCLLELAEGFASLEKGRGTFATARQEAQASYVSFINGLQARVGRQVNKTEAADTLLSQVAKRMLMQMVWLHFCSFEGTDLNHRGIGKSMSESRDRSARVENISCCSGKDANWTTQERATGVQVMFQLWCARTFSEGM